MSRVKRFEMIVNLAAQDLDAATQQLATIRQQQSNLQQQVNELKHYMADYLESLTGKGNSMMPVQLQTTQAFTDKMRHAIRNQEFKLVAMEPAVIQAEDVWREKKARLQALEKVLDKIRKGVQAALDKSEQRMLDDLAAQNFLRREDLLG